MYADSSRWHEAAKRIRAESPIVKAITRHDDVMEIERRPEQFTNAPVPTLAPLDRVAAMEQTPVNALIQMDRKQHKANRNLDGIEGVPDR